MVLMVRRTRKPRQHTYTYRRKAGKKRTWYEINIFRNEGNDLISHGRPVVSINDIAPNRMTCRVCRKPAYTFVVDATDEDFIPFCSYSCLYAFWGVTHCRDCGCTNARIKRDQPTTRGVFSFVALLTDMNIMLADLDLALKALKSDLKTRESDAHVLKRLPSDIEDLQAQLDKLKAAARAKTNALLEPTRSLGYGGGDA